MLPKLPKPSVNTYTLGDQQAIWCPLCGGKMRDLWEVDPTHEPFFLRCEHCDTGLAITTFSDHKWKVLICY